MNKRQIYDFVEAMHREGLSGAEIARLLGVSRQRVCQIKGDLGLKQRRQL